MKKPLYFLFALMVLLSSCGSEPQKVSDDEMDTLMHDLSSCIQMSERSFSSYQNFTNAMGINQGMYDLLIENLTADRDSVNSVVVYTGDQYVKNDTKALKDATISILDAYLAGAKEEIKSLHEASDKEELDEEMATMFLTQYQDRLTEKYEVYNKIQEKIAKEYESIILY